LFAPGFSTAAVTTDLSGRGVGMDAVRDGVRALGGDIQLTSEPGAGTLAELRLPLTLASIHALLVERDGRPWAIPLERVVRTVRLASHPVRTVRGAPLLPLGGELLPIVGSGSMAAIVSTTTRRVALAVDALVGQRELVTRALPRSASTREATAGAVLPDGSIALVLDCDALLSPATEGVPA
jgi:two-component system chemotaxis sensor kinase CheA